MTGLATTGHTPATTTDPRGALDAIRATLLAAVDDLDHLVEAGATGTLAHRLDWLRTIRRDLAEVERAHEDAVAGLMDDKVMEVDGLTLERRTGTKRKAWQSDDLLARVIRTVMVDDDGERRHWDHPDDLRDALVDVVRRAMPVTPSMGWRVTALRDLGLDPSDWCDESPGRTSVQIASGGTS